jgi:HSP20 family protein
MMNLWNVFDDVMRSDPWLSGVQSGPSRFAPALDVAEAEDAYFIQLELPGVKPEHVKLEWEGDVLSISGEKVRAPESEAGHHIGERRYGSFARSFRIPVGVKLEEVDARLHDGILSVRLPKADQARRRRIPVQTTGHPLTTEGTEVKNLAPQREVQQLNQGRADREQADTQQPHSG